MVKGAQNWADASVGWPRCLKAVSTHVIVHSRGGVLDQVCAGSLTKEITQCGGQSVPRDLYTHIHVSMWSKALMEHTISEVALHTAHTQCILGKVALHGKFPI